jgi:D-alanyl-D-alanine carboxypeptidase/D-alanyl-D-alanine-endopeptidase (penicillin-binding protein 4)
MLDGAAPAGQRRIATVPDAGAGRRRALAVALGVNPATVTTAPGPAAGDELASVQSAPLIERLRQMMSVSDNVMAESIAREVAGHDQRPRSFAGAVAAVTDRLSRAGVEMTGATLYDSSGLSVLDRLTATNLDEVVSLAAGPDQPALRPLVDLLPVAGGSGTLSDRFLDPETSQGAAAGCGPRPGR